jgi:hypothetical protein
MISYPQQGEYPSYATKYIQKIAKERDVLDIMDISKNEMLLLLASLHEKTRIEQHAEGKWTVKEILQHMIDTERIFSYRALRFARYDDTKLPGYDETEYVNKSFANERPLEEMVHEFRLVRESTIALFKSFDIKVYDNTSLANGYTMSVRAIAYIIAGHGIYYTQAIAEKCRSEE